MSPTLLIGIDLGGTKIEGIVLGPDLAPLRRLRVPTERERGYEHIVGRVAEVVAALRPEAPACRTIGIGTPGLRSVRTGLQKNSNTTCLNGRLLKDDLEARLGPRCASRTTPTASRWRRRARGQGGVTASSSA